MADFYALLGVPKNASDDEIRRAYRRLARELHPDANGGNQESEARFKEVTVAYETLRDPERRRRYDLFGDEPERGSVPTGDMFGGGLGDLFDAFFNQGPFGSARSAAPHGGEDIEVSVEIAFQAAVFGAEVPASFRAPSRCDECAGTGAAKGTSAITCVQCAGAGQLRKIRQSILGQVVTTSACPRCRGAGRVVETPCARCRGEGRVSEERSVKVEVPAGVDDGTTLRIPGAGAAAPHGGPPGDLYVHLRVLSHERFERSGQDLVYELHVPFTKASLGASIDIETLDGTETIRLPEGTQTGKTYRLRGLGVPQLHGRGRGDLHVRVIVDTPQELSKDQARLLREFAALRGEQVDEEGGIFSRIRSTLS